MRVISNGSGMTPEEALEYQARAFEAIPLDFKGSLLEVPVGTGVLSMPVWKTLPDANITCLDYSEKMMAAAERRAEEMGIKNIAFQQGDVGSLPYGDETFDAVVSLNGFHAFPDKEAAYRETFRVLKPGGELYFSDVYASRRLPEELRDDPILHSECLGGATYAEDFRQLRIGRDGNRMGAVGAAGGALPMFYVAGGNLRRDVLPE